MSQSRLVLVFLLVFICGTAVAQRDERMASRHLSKTDLHAFLLYKSKKEKARAIGTAVVGPVLTGVGIYLYNKKSEALPPGVQEKTSPHRLIGLLMGSLGISTTLCSIPLFISAAELEREARLVLSNQSAAFVNSRIALPGIGLQFRF